MHDTRTSRARIRITLSLIAMIGYCSDSEKDTIMHLSLSLHSPKSLSIFDRSVWSGICVCASVHVCSFVCMCWSGNTPTDGTSNETSNLFLCSIDSSSDASAHSPPPPHSPSLSFTCASLYHSLKAPDPPHPLAISSLPLLSFSPPGRAHLQSSPVFISS